jgi:hypothetical protein
MHHFDHQFPEKANVNKFEISLRQYKIARKKRNFVPNEYDFLSLMKKN